MLCHEEFILVLLMNFLVNSCPVYYPCMIAFKSYVHCLLLANINGHESQFSVRYSDESSQIYATYLMERDTRLKDNSQESFDKNGNKYLS